MCGGLQLAEEEPAGAGTLDADLSTQPGDRRTRRAQATVTVKPIIGSVRTLVPAIELGRGVAMEDLNKSRSAPVRVCLLSGAIDCKFLSQCQKVMSAPYRPISVLVGYRPLQPQSRHSISMNSAVRFRSWGRRLVDGSSVGSSSPNPHRSVHVLTSSRCRVERNSASQMGKRMNSPQRTRVCAR